MLQLSSLCLFRGLWICLLWCHVVTTYKTNFCHSLHLRSHKYFLVSCRPEDRIHCCLHRAKPATAIAATALLSHACRSSVPRCPPGSPPCSTLWRSAILNSRYSSVIRTSSPLAQELRELFGKFVHALEYCCEPGHKVFCTR